MEALGTILEGILDADDISATLDAHVNVEQIFKKYYWRPTSYEWVGKTLKLVFDGRSYMDNFEAAAKELNCKSFDVYPWALISGIDVLDGYTIRARTNLNISCNEIKNCKLTAGNRVIVGVPANKKFKMSGTTIDCWSLKLDGIDTFQFTGCSFGQVESLALTHVGSKLEKTASGWNLVTVYPDHRWKSWPKPVEKPDPDMNPIKDCGLDKYFKNLTEFCICGPVGYRHKCIIFTNRYKKQSHDWGVDNLINLSNGWQGLVMDTSNI